MIFGHYNISYIYIYIYILHYIVYIIKHPSIYELKTELLFPKVHGMNWHKREFNLHFLLVIKSDCHKVMLGVSIYESLQNDLGHCLKIKWKSRNGYNWVFHVSSCPGTHSYLIFDILKKSARSF